MKYPMLLILGLVWSSLSMATEEPAYRVTNSDGAFEIRDYGAMTIAETLVSGDFDDAANSAFGTLFGYISGRNAPREKIAMTAPVRQQTEPDGSFRVGFIAPSTYSPGTAPKPADGRVQLREVPAQRMAVARYSGRWTEESFRAHEAGLLEWVRARGLVTTGPVVYARYNAPYVPWPMRRNEVMVPVGESGQR